MSKRNGSVSAFFFLSSPQNQKSSYQDKVRIRSIFLSVCFRANFIFKLIYGLLLTITHCKIHLCKVCRQLVLLTLFKPKYCILLSVCKENHVRHRYTKETLKHRILSLAKPRKEVDQLPIFEENQRKGHYSKGHMP